MCVKTFDCHSFYVCAVTVRICCHFAYVASHFQRSSTANKITIPQLKAWAKTVKEIIIKFCMNSRPNRQPVVSLINLLLLFNFISFTRLRNSEVIWNGFLSSRKSFHSFQNCMSSFASLPQHDNTLSLDHRAWNSTLVRSLCPVW